MSVYRTIGPLVVKKDNVDLNRQGSDHLFLYFFNFFLYLYLFIYDLPSPIKIKWSLPCNVF